MLDFVELAEMGWEADWISLYVHIAAEIKKNGKCVTSIRNLMKVSGASFWRVRKFIEICKTAQFTAQFTAHVNLVITDSKIDNCEGLKNQKRTPNRTVHRTEKDEKERSKEKEESLTPLKKYISNEIKESPPSFVSPEFRDVFDEWLAYKRERHENYKTQSSMKAAYNRMVNLSNNEPEAARRMVQNSIANYWQGLYKERSYGKDRRDSEEKFDEEIRNLVARKLSQ